MWPINFTYLWTFILCCYFFISMLTRTILTTTRYPIYTMYGIFFERLVCLPKNSTCLVLWETHLSYHCLANLYFQGKSYSKLKFSNMRTQYLYNHKLGNFSIIIVYETFNLFRLYFSIQNSSHFSMLGLGDIVSNIKMYIGKR